MTPAKLGVRMVRYSFPVPLFHRRLHAGFIPAHPYPPLRSGLQQCPGCHTVETETKFAHIPNRGDSESSHLSTFLTGSDRGVLRPNLEDLYNGSNLKTVNVKYDTYPAASGCMTAVISEVPAKSKFHDIARRTLFLAGVIADGLPDSQNNPMPPAHKLSTQSVE
jgi:hypothetical protein